MKTKRKRVSEISKEAFLAYYNHDRIRLDVLPMTAKELFTLWKRACRYAPAATEDTICLRLSNRDMDIIKRLGFEVKTRYI